MAAGKYNFTIEEGSTFTKVLTWYTDETRTTPVDLTSYTARMDIRATIDTVATIIELTTENGGIALGGTAGTITLTITATQTGAMDFDSAVHDLEMITGTTVTRLVEGKVNFSPEVTQSA